jgi:hypothetical protein
MFISRTLKTALNGRQAEAIRGYKDLSLERKRSDLVQ